MAEQAADAAPDEGSAQPKKRAERTGLEQECGAKRRPSPGPGHQEKRESEAARRRAPWIGASRGMRNEAPDWKTRG